jgi:hypothetical protein
VTARSFGYPRSRRFAAVVVQDLLLAAVVVGVSVARPAGPFGVTLAAGALAALVWQVATLHFPRRIEVSESEIAFLAYGRAHRFAWDRVEQCRVRRFLVGDRIFVRIAPSSSFRGRYWILDSLEGFDELAATLLARQTQLGERRATPRVEAPRG